MSSTTSIPSLRDALTGMPRVSAAGWRRLDWLRRYLIAVRAAVLPLTLFSCLFGGLLALPWTPAEGGRLLLATVTLLFAHAAGNLLNDQIDWLVGVDRDRYFRVRYGAHPLAQGLMHPLGHVLLLALTASVALWLGIALCRSAGTPAWWLAGVGASLSVFYTWPLKRLALGELAIFLIWGPLLAGGVYWLVSGDWGPEILLLSALFGLGPTVVVLGKHCDKRADDAARGIRTLPVRLGPVWGPRVTVLAAVVQLCGGLGWAVTTEAWAYLLLLAALPALLGLIRVGLRRRPTARPKRFPTAVWPLWYGAAAFRFARASSVALVVAALLDGL
ncbi:MAG TPA: prenyltransferase [Pseudomonadales bacterium]